jgi:signal transduction histidine kinase
MPMRETSELSPQPEEAAVVEGSTGDGEFHPPEVTCRLRRVVHGLSPDRLLALIVVLIVLAEVGCVVIHLLLPELSLGLEVVLETSILLGLLLPPYYFIYRPFWRERQQAEDKIRLLSRQLIRSEEKTRKTLARDLHDEFGQVLTALQFGVETICNSLHADQNKLATHCARLSRMIAQLGNHVRDVTAELRPTMLDNVGLVPALRCHAVQFETMHGVKVLVRAGGDVGRLPPDVEITLYRICQESLNNVAKHARARQVRISLKRAPELLALTVKDDGAGFDTRFGLGTAAEGFGILGMRERIADLGGLFEVVSRPGKGTEVRVRLPLAEGAEE